MRLTKVTVYTGFVLVILTCFLYGLFIINAKSKALSLLNNWRNSEAISIQQGDYLSSFAKISRIISNSDYLVGAKLVDLQSKQQKTLATLGSVDSSKFSIKEKTEVVQNGISLYVSTGLVSSSLGIVFYVRPIRDFYILLVFCFLLSLNFLGFVFLIRRNDKTVFLAKEKTKIDTLKKVMKQITHDIRSPLSAIGIVLSANKNIGKESQQLVSDSISRIEEIVEQTLKSNINNSIVLTTLDEALSGVLAEFKEASHQKDIDLRFSISSSSFRLSYEALVNLKRSISILLSNAFEAMESGGVITLNAEFKDNFLTVKCVDEGCGIPESMLKSFGEYGLTTKGPKGNGVGVNFVKEFAEANGGFINAKPGCEKGTIVTFGMNIDSKI